MEILGHRGRRWNPVVVARRAGRRAAGSRTPNGQREIIAGFARAQRVFASRTARRAVVDQYTESKSVMVNYA
ncbi:MULTISPECIES: hypothetical protein [Burkholderia]|uniref:hypothetical protein n=1 Tax=Burkholderia TaxID=32008 RepID=UPI001177FFC5|nr:MULTISPECIES: hypothetical protein [Burkholderia]MBY4727529.1 hypothetical protein [Burkholderia contaminans]MCI3968780.1 hypothetical protein [Burkholderia sp. HI4860]MDN7788835.1 hypothetical protein [Burkholderia contaminans]